MGSSQSKKTDVEEEIEDNDMTNKEVVLMFILCIFGFVGLCYMMYVL